MALIKKIKYRGVVNEYWNIGQLHLDFPAGDFRLVVNGYTKKEDREESSTPTAQITYQLPRREVNKLVDILYPYIESMDEFSRSGEDKTVFHPVVEADVAALNKWKRVWNALSFKK